MGHATGHCDAGFRTCTDFQDPRHPMLCELMQEQIARDAQRKQRYSRKKRNETCLDKGSQKASQRKNCTCFTRLLRTIFVDRLWHATLAHLLKYTVIARSGTKDSSVNVILNVPFASTSQHTQNTGVRRRLARGKKTPGVMYLVVVNTYVSLFFPPFSNINDFASKI